MDNKKEDLANKICKVLEKNLLELGFSRLKHNSAVKGLKNIKKFNRSSNFDSIASGVSGNETNRSLKEGYDSKGSSTPSLASRYTTIKPL
jgi:hypothetical protein